MKWARAQTLDGDPNADIPVSRIQSPLIVPVPVIRAVSKIFKDFLVISIGGTTPGLEFHYTTDGSEPSIRASRFTRPFLIDQSRTVKAIAINRSGQTSLVARAEYHRIPHQWAIQLGSKYSTQYNGGGNLALIDGIRGTKNWSGGGWQGYQGQDLVATVDLGRVQSVSKLGAGFLQDIDSWIWMPREVEFEVSTDGQSFKHVLSIPVNVSEKDYGVIIKDFESKIPQTKARYIRLRARSYGKLPSWHPGSGGDAWIFVDEIIVE